MEIFFQSEEYKKMKSQYEQQCFKLIYLMFNNCWYYTLF